MDDIKKIIESYRDAETRLHNAIDEIIKNPPNYAINSKTLVIDEEISDYGRKTIVYRFNVDIDVIEKYSSPRGRWRTLKITPRGRAFLVYSDDGTYKIYYYVPGAQEWHIYIINPEDE